MLRKVRNYQLRIQVNLFLIRLGQDDPIIRMKIREFLNYLKAVTLPAHCYSDSFVGVVRESYTELIKSLPKNKEKEVRHFYFYLIECEFYKINKRFSLLYRAMNSYYKG